MEDKDIIIHPRKGRNERLLPARALLVVNPTEARFAIKEFGKHDAEKRFLHNSTLLVDRSLKFCLAGPGLGAPAAGLIMEKLIVLGVREFCLFSCCGAIDAKLSIGDVFLATSGVSGEGVSRYYGGNQSVESCRKATKNMRLFLSEAGIDWREGAVWSTDAPYRESRTALAGLQDDFGVCGIDMEFSALCAIAAFRNVSLTGIFVVSDELWGSEWQPGFKKKKYQDRCKTIITQLIDRELRELDIDENI